MRRTSRHAYGHWVAGEVPHIAREPGADGGPAGLGFGLEFNELGYYKEGESEGVSGIFSHLSVWNADIVILSTTMDGTWPLLGEFVRRARNPRGDGVVVSR